MGNSNNICGYMAMVASIKMLAAVKVVSLKIIICLARMLYLMVKDALGLGTTVKATWDAATLKMQSLLETCWCLATHFQWSIKSACLLH